MSENEQGSDPALRAQLGEIMKDPAWGKDPALTAKVDALYRNRYGDGKVDLGSKQIVVTGRESAAPPADTSLPVKLGSGITIGGEVPEGSPQFDPDVYGPDAAERHALIEGELRKAWGNDFDARRSDASAEARALFENHGEVFDSLSRTIRQSHGPAGEAETMRYLARMAAIRRGDR